MAISLVHPIKRKIDTQYYFLLSSLEHFPSLMKEWENNQFAEHKKNARIIAEGDKEVEYSVMSNYHGDEYASDVLCLFFNSLTIAIYSYYESIIRDMAKDLFGSDINLKSSKLLDEVLARKKIELITEEKELVTLFGKEYSSIRNQLCHNNNGTPNEKYLDLILNICKDNEGVDFFDGVLNISSDMYPIKMLEDAHRLLLSLAKKFDYKTKMITNGDVIYID